MNTEKPWISNYSAKVPIEIDCNLYKSVVSLLEETFNKYADKTAFICVGRSISFKELEIKSNHFAAFLQSKGLKKGDKIALMMPNLLQYPIALFGSLKAGLIVVNTNPLYTPREMEHQFKDSEAKAIVICENFAANLQKIINKTSIKTVITASIGELLGFPKSLIVNFMVRKVKKMVPAFNLPKSITFSECLSIGRSNTFTPVTHDPEDVILLQYTGGTTGVSKGAMLTHRNLIANMLQIRAILFVYLEEGKEMALSPLPLYHIFAFTVNCLALMSFGTSTVLVTNARDFQSIIKEFKAYPISVFTGVNTLFNALLNQSNFAEVDFSSLKVAVGGGMAVQKSVADRWKDITGVTLTEGYGLTETSPVVCVNPVDGTGQIGTIGMPLPSTDVRIVNEEGEPLTAGGIGELQVKGPQVMLGYYNNPEATSEVIQNGWFSTGDIGFMQDDGYFKIVDRKKDMILVSGFNVYPNEIEEVVAMNEKVLEVAAIGVLDVKCGEVVKIVVVKKDESLTEEELIAHCRKNLTGYKIPKFVEFRTELPKTNVGKILRRELKNTP